MTGDWAPQSIAPLYHPAVQLRSAGKHLHRRLRRPGPIAIAHVFFRPAHHSDRQPTPAQTRNNGPQWRRQILSESSTPTGSTSEIEPVVFQVKLNLKGITQPPKKRPSAQSPRASNAPALKAGAAASPIGTPIVDNVRDPHEGCA